jgi:hypothetical protein
VPNQNQIRESHTTAFASDKNAFAIRIRYENLIRLHLRPHTAIYVSSYCYIYVLILLHMCPHTAIYVSSYRSSLLPLHMCPHTTTYVSSYCYICVLILLCMFPHTGVLAYRGHRAKSECDNTYVLILLYMCPHTATYVSSYRSSLLPRASCQIRMSGLAAYSVAKSTRTCRLCSSGGALLVVVAAWVLAAL